MNSIRDLEILHMKTTTKLLTTTCFHGFRRLTCNILVKNKRFHNFRHKNIFVRDYRNNLSQKWLRIHACLSHMQLIWKSEVLYHVICGRWMLFQYEKAKAFFQPVPYFAFQDHVGLISLLYGPSMGLVMFYKWTFLDVPSLVQYNL